MDADEVRRRAGVELDAAEAEAVAQLVARVEADLAALAAELELEGVEPFAP
ncbi:MAG: hypothetical protein M3155_08540 [Actinomycetota bacterium]|nr:hypothetical protein [Actinomycetota bacterium]